MARKDTTWLTRVSAVLCIFGEFRSGAARMHGFRVVGGVTKSPDRVCMCAV